MTVGLTGPSGSGKSTAACAAAEVGWSVIDCDSLTREVYKNADVLSALKSAFGESVFGADGTLDRKKLAALAFADGEHTSLLNATVLPFVVRALENELKKISGEKVLVDAPTLFESGADRFCDATVAVLCGAELRLSRITVRDGLTGDEAALRINAGKSDRFYTRRSDYVIYNGGDIGILKRNITNTLNTILSRGGKYNG